MTTMSPPLHAPLSEAEFGRLTALSRRLPLPWTASARRRRLLLLALAAPGFLAVFSTPLHHTFPVLVAGLVAFAAALVFRTRTERVFVRAEAAALWPPSPVLSPQTPETPRA